MEEISIVKAKETADFEVAKGLFEAYANSLGFDLSFQSFDEELANIKTVYSAPNGGLLLVSLDGDYIGCVGVRKIGDGIGELKRMYLKEEARGKGLGRTLMEEAILLSRELNFTALRLDTLPSMKSAVGLYEKMGFEKIPPYRENPFSEALFFELKL